MFQNGYDVLTLRNAQMITHFTRTNQWMHPADTHHWIALGNADLRPATQERGRAGRCLNRNFARYTRHAAEIPAWSFAIPTESIDVHNRQTQQNARRLSETRSFSQSKEAKTYGS